MTGAVVIRTIVADDAAAIYPLLQALNIETDERPAERPPETLADFIAADRLYGHVAETDAETVGYCLGHDCVTTDHLEPGSYLSDLYVVEAWRRRGIGRRLLDAFCVTVAARDGTHIWWMALKDNHRARAAYRAYGAHEDARLVAFAHYGPPFRKSVALGQTDIDDER